eukprot:m.102993 g.102993  ORF g.102993 m.102993 type:complete len:125 (+) comp9037_c0_seq1:669-1043(+)
MLLAWPDISEESIFGAQCIEAFKGMTIVHIGELAGQTLSANPWGQVCAEALYHCSCDLCSTLLTSCGDVQSTSARCQQALWSTFRCVARVPLHTWPGMMDELTIWKRAEAPVECDGAFFVALAD